MSFKGGKGSELLFTKTNRNDRFKQMTKQEQLIEEKKRQIMEKLEDQKRKEAEEALKKIQSNDSKSTKKGLGLPSSRWKSNMHRSHNKEDDSLRSGNIFSNDGTFLDKFRKLSGFEGDTGNKKNENFGNENSSKKSSRDGDRRDDRRDRDHRREHRRDRSRERSGDRKRYRDDSGERRRRRRESRRRDRWSDRRDRSRSLSRSSVSSESQTSMLSEVQGTTPCINNDLPISSSPSSIPLMPQLSTNVPIPLNPLTISSSVNPYSIPPPSPLIPQSIPPPNPLPPQNIPPPSPIIPQTIPPPSPLTPQNIPAPVSIMPCPVQPPNSVIPLSLPQTTIAPGPPVIQQTNQLASQTPSMLSLPLLSTTPLLAQQLHLQIIQPVQAPPLPIGPSILNTYSIPPPQSLPTFATSVNLTQPPPPIPLQASCKPLSADPAICDTSIPPPPPVSSGNLSQISPSLGAQCQPLMLQVPADKIQGNPDSLGSGCVKQELCLGDSKAWFKQCIENESYDLSKAIKEEIDIKEEKTEYESESKFDRAAKRRSRWGDASSATNSIPPVQIVAPVALGSTTPTISVTGMSGHLLSKVTRTDPALLQYTQSTYGTINLSEEDWKKAEDNYKIHLLYQDMMRKRAEVERLQARGKNKYEYDSDEEFDGGTWEHRAREKEMIATREWADSLTEAAKGKHHIGDFLPPEELKNFLEKYSAVKEGQQPDLSDYKEYKLKEDNKGFQMLQKLGWTEGQGLGTDGSGIVEPINKAKNRDSNQGLGVVRPDDVSSGDDEYDAYRKRMMLAYRFRPNPLNNPRRPYY